MSACKELKRIGEITRIDIEKRHSPRNPAYVAAILAELPRVTYSLRPIRLIYSDPDDNAEKPERIKLPLRREYRMGGFVNPRFRKAIIDLGNAYGGLAFWPENLMPNKNPDATWRALLYLGCSKKNQYADTARRLLKSRDSRVRAWACFALGQFEDDLAVEKIYRLNADLSNRVRIHAWQAIQVLVGPEESARHFPIRIPQKENLILISDDSKRGQDHLSQLLRNRGFLVVTASTEQETMELAFRVKPQAIITDNQKGRGRDNLSGLNMTWDICRHPKLRETTLFMLTADRIEPVFLWNGGDYFLWKFRTRVDKLCKVVEEYLHH